MENLNSDLEKSRIFRYSKSRLKLLGPSSLGEESEKIKSRFMSISLIDSKQYDELFQDLQEQNDWDNISTMAYFDSVLMFE